MFNLIKKKLKSIKEEIVGKDLEELKLELMENGIPLDIADKIVEEYKNFKDLKSILPKYIAEEFDFKNFIDNIEEKPIKILVLGINGSGKTTFIYKLSNLLKNKGKILVAAADTFRAAAIEQLETLMSKLDVDIYKKDYGHDPTSVAYDALNIAKSKKYDFLIIDTAGRLHSKKDLIKELDKMVRKIKPDIKLLIVDASIGQDLEEELETFSKYTDAIVVNKVDIDEKGSIFFIAKEKGIKIAFLGKGQDINDIEIYNKNKILNKLIEE